MLRAVNSHLLAADVGRICWPLGGSPRTPCSSDPDHILRTEAAFAHKAPSDEMAGHLSPTPTFSGAPGPVGAERLSSRGSLDWDYDASMSSQVSGVHSQLHTKHRCLTLSVTTLALSGLQLLIGLIILESQLGHTALLPSLVTGS